MGTHLRVMMFKSGKSVMIGIHIISRGGPTYTGTKIECQAGVRIPAEGPEPSLVIFLRLQAAT